MRLREVLYSAVQLHYSDSMTLPVVAAAFLWYCPPRLLDAIELTREIVGIGRSSSYQTA